MPFETDWPGLIALSNRWIESGEIEARAAEVVRRRIVPAIRKPYDWNEYTVIARGGTLIHIVNGQLMAVMVDDDPESINNRPGLFGIEIEATTKVSVRNIWLRKLN